MQLHNLKGHSDRGFASFGSVWNQGEVFGTEFLLKGENGDNLELQSRVTAFWPDGSTKWAAHVADAQKMGTKATLEVGKTPEVSEKIRCIKIPGGCILDTGSLQLTVPGLMDEEKRETEFLFQNACIDGRLRTKGAYPVMYLEHPVDTSVCGLEMTQKNYAKGVTQSVTLEQSGPLQCVVTYRGYHKETFWDASRGQWESRNIMPFVVRMYLWQGSSQIKFVHTFLYDGNEAADYLKGLGICVETCLSGGAYDRQVQFVTDGAHFAEPAMKLYSNRPRLGEDIFSAQMAWKRPEFDEDDDIGRAVSKLPVWNRFGILQDSAYHYRIYKQTQGGCAVISCAEGKRTDGCMAVADADGGLLFGIRDFWQKYPSGLEVTGLGTQESTCTMWFYSPMAESFDFRHYDTRSYPDTCYEGFEEVGASAYGIGVTSECRVEFFSGHVKSEDMEAFSCCVQKPPIYVSTPQYYHDKRAFGYWSMVQQDTPMKEMLEKELERAFAFYQSEVEARSWYGLFDYGDVMHTYDPVRHVWRYDMGGYAWQNTELVPTYWLWLYFLRTGREDVFSMAQAMSRHCSEVDLYHFGQFKGLGSRHNVRHWGCSCKEPRIAMAGHHRFLYYLTGEERLADIFEIVKDADLSSAQNKYCQMKLPDGRVIPGTRSGPDWSSYVSNWMTMYEMTLDEKYRKKIERGISDLENTPYGLMSGPDYGYDPTDGHLIYVGEMEDTPNQHLQICMGGPQIWWELCILLKDDRMNNMLEQLGAVYFLDKEEKSRLTNGKIHHRNFGWPMLACGIAAYSAMKRQDDALAGQTWEILLSELSSRGMESGFSPSTYGLKKDGTPLLEVQGISTNTTAQWCLNVMMCLEFISQWL